MQVQVRDRIPMDLVVELGGTGDVPDGFGDEKDLLPERGPARSVQLERLHDVQLRHDADVAGEWRLAARGDPRDVQTDQDVPRLPALANHATIRGGQCPSLVGPAHWGATPA